MLRGGMSLCAGVVIGVGCAVSAPPLDLDSLVRQLDDPDQRIAAAQALVAQGEPAGYALLAELERAVAAGRTPRQREALRLLRALGPAGGIILEPLLTLSPRIDGSAGRELVLTVAELAPYRPASLVIAESEVGMWQHRVGCEPRELRRLFVRAWSDGRGDLPTLIAMAGEVDPHRIELAVEAMTRMGARARTAIPILHAVLQRPDPRVIGTPQLIPLRAAAARAILRIDAGCSHAEHARAVDTGNDPGPPPASIPEATRRRIAALLAAFEVPEERAIAGAHLIELGAEGVRALLQAVTAQPTDPRAYQLALDATSRPGAELAPVVAELAALLPLLPVEDHPRLIDAFARAVPHARDVLALRIPNHLRDRGLEAAVRTAYDHLQAALDTPGWLPDRALAQAAARGSLAHIERATTLLRDRGAAARAALPILTVALRRNHSGLLEIPVAGGGTFHPSDAPEFTLARAQVARAILAIADANDPLVAEARRVLAPGR